MGRTATVSRTGKRFLTFLQGPGLPNSTAYLSLHRIADRMRGSTARAFSDAMARLQAGINLPLLEQALRSGNLNAIESAAGSARIQTVLTGDPTLINLLNRTTTLTGNQTARVLSGALHTNVQFNATNPNVTLYARTQGANLVRAVTATQAEGIRIITALGSEVGITVKDQARAIREIVGLPPNWVNAPGNFRNELMAGELNRGRLLANPLTRGERGTGERWARQIEAGIAAGKNLDPAWVDAQVNRYAQNLVDRRAMNIAHTETMRAANAGQRESWKQAKAQGVLPREAMRVWIVTPDDRLCDECVAVPDDNPDGVPMEGGLYVTPAGEVDGPPLHTSCRCSEGLIFPAPGAAQPETDTTAGTTPVPEEDQATPPDETQAEPTGTTPSPEEVPGTTPAPEGTRGTPTMPEGLTQAAFKDNNFESIFGADGYPVVDREDMVALFNNYDVRMTPEEIVRSVANVPGDWTVQGDVYVSGSRLALDVEFADAAGQRAGLMRRFLDFETGTVEHDVFVLDRAYQGNGLAKQLLETSVDTYQRLGLERVSLQANLDVGGYAWARYGFLPDRESWRLYRSELAEVLRDEPPAWVTAAQRDNLLKVLDQSDPQAIRILASSPEGKKLMLGTTWDGTLNLKDKESMDFFRAYVHPAPEPVVVTTPAETGLTKATFVIGKTGEPVPNTWFVGDESSGAYAAAYDRLAQARGFADVSPEDIARSLINVPDNWTVKVSEFVVNSYTTEEGITYGSIQLNAGIFDAAGKNAGTISRDIGFGMSGTRAEHHLLILGKEYRGNGLAKELLNSSVRLYEKMGVKSVALEANLDVGGYAWARYGFLPKDDYTWQTLAGRMRADVRRMHSALVEKYGPEKYEQVLSLLKSKDREAIRVLASNPMGKELLLGKSWRGVLNLEDKESMDLFRAYVKAEPKIVAPAPPPPPPPPPKLYGETVHLPANGQTLGRDVFRNTEALAREIQRQVTWEDAHFRYAAIVNRDLPGNTIATFSANRATITVGRRLADQLQAAMAGQKTRETYDGVMSLVHEMFHSASGAIGRLENVGAQWLEEGLVELRAQRAASAMFKGMFSDHQIAMWTERGGAYAKQVDALKWLEKNGADLDKMYRAGVTRAGLLSDACESALRSGLTRVGYTEEEIRDVFWEIHGSHTGLFFGPETWRTALEGGDKAAVKKMLGKLKDWNYSKITPLYS